MFIVRETIVHSVLGKLAVQMDIDASKGRFKKPMFLVVDYPIYHCHRLEKYNFLMKGFRKNFLKNSFFIRNMLQKRLQKWPTLFIDF